MPLRRIRGWTKPRKGRRVSALASPPIPFRTSMKYPLILLALAAGAQPRLADPPALANSGMPYLASAPNGAVYLSWTDYLSETEHSLRFAKWNGSKWGPAETIAQGSRWFVNFVDFPSLSVGPDGSMLAHWLAKSPGAGRFGYGIRVARRDPATAEWSEIHGISLDEKDDYAGFLSFAPGGRGAIYLAPPAQSANTARDNRDDGHRKTVRYLSLHPNGTVESDRLLDADACSCCQTAIGRTPKGLVAAYRDHLPGEVRDISVIRFLDSAWTKPKTLHADGWIINGCPTEGPDIATIKSEVAITWLTRAAGIPKVQLALSADEGITFRAPLRIDGGSPLGHPAITAFDSTGYIVLWLEKTSETNAEIRLRRVSSKGRLHKPVVVAAVPAGRAAGIPKVAVSGDNIIVTWRDGRVRAAILTRQDLK